MKAPEEVYTIFSKVGVAVGIHVEHHTVDGWLKKLNEWFPERAPHTKVRYRLSEPGREL